VSQAHYRYRFQIDHVLAEKHGGTTEFSNLALACLHCNLFKGPNIAGFDGQTRRVVRLFNPRRDRWSRHFLWRGATLVGRTSIGRVTVDVLNINDPDYLKAREELIAEGLFLPSEK
jgi:hypothetical protein